MLLDIAFIRHGENKVQFLAGLVGNECQILAASQGCILSKSRADGKFQLRRVSFTGDHLSCCDITVIEDSPVQSEFLVVPSGDCCYVCDKSGRNVFVVGGSDSFANGLGSMCVAEWSSVPSFKGKCIAAIGGTRWDMYAADDNGNVFAWGLSHELVPRFVNSLSKIVAGRRVVKICGGAQHCLILLSDGQVLVFGDNSEGQLGIGKGPARAFGDPCVHNLNATDIAAGRNHSVALVRLGETSGSASEQTYSLVGWGSNLFSQLGRSAVASVGSEPKTEALVTEPVSAEASPASPLVESFAFERVDHPRPIPGAPTRISSIAAGSCCTLVSAEGKLFIVGKHGSSLWPKFTRFVDEITTARRVVISPSETSSDEVIAIECERVISEVNPRLVAVCGDKFVTTPADSSATMKLSVTCEASSNVLSSLTASDVFLTSSGLKTRIPASQVATLEAGTPGQSILLEFDIEYSNLLPGSIAAGKIPVSIAFGASADICVVDAKSLDLKLCGVSSVNLGRAKEVVLAGMPWRTMFELSPSGKDLLERLAATGDETQPLRVGADFSSATLLTRAEKVGAESGLWTSEIFVSSATAASRCDVDESGLVSLNVYAGASYMGQLHAEVRRISVVGVSPGALLKPSSEPVDIVINFETDIPREAFGESTGISWAVDPTAEGDKKSEVAQGAASAEPDTSKEPVSSGQQEGTAHAEATAEASGTAMSQAPEVAVAGPDSSLNISTKAPAELSTSMPSAVKKVSKGTLTSKILPSSPLTAFGITLPVTFNSRNVSFPVVTINVGVGPDSVDLSRCTSEQGVTPLAVGKIFDLGKLVISGTFSVESEKVASSLLSAGIVEFRILKGPVPKISAANIGSSEPSPSQSTPSESTPISSSEVCVVPPKDFSAYEAQEIIVVRSPLSFRKLDFQESTLSYSLTVAVPSVSSLPEVDPIWLSGHQHAFVNVRLIVGGVCDNVVKNAEGLVDPSADSGQVEKQQVEKQQSQVDKQLEKAQPSAREQEFFILKLPS